MALSGGADSVYLAYRCSERPVTLVLAHFNHRARGKDSDEDQMAAERIGRSLGLPIEVAKARMVRRTTSFPPPSGRANRSGFERKAREVRYDFLKKVKAKYGAKKILVAHTADDQVETILMRILEGGGLAGLKGIPRETDDGVDRPLLETWREDILAYLHRKGIAYREDRSNRDIRFERNWIRQVLIPLLEERYGKSVKKRIFTLGERFRELDSYVDTEARNWLNKNGIVLSKDSGRARGVRRDNSQRPLEDVRFLRKGYSVLPSVVRMRILQLICFDRVGRSPNERLLGSMDRVIRTGGASGHLSIGRGWSLGTRYGEARFASPDPIKPSGRKASPSGKTERLGAGRTGKTGKNGIRNDQRPTEPVLRMNGPGRYLWPGEHRAETEGETGRFHAFLWEESAGVAGNRIRSRARDELWVAFDGEGVVPPLSVRPLRKGDRIRPFGLESEKKVKEILIDRKVPRGDRWGRPVVCDANGVILWIPGVVRSAHAPLTRRTRRPIVLRMDDTGTSRRMTGYNRGHLC